MMELVSRAAKSLKPRMVDDLAQIRIEIGTAIRATETARVERTRLLAAHDAELDDTAAEALLRQWRDQGRAVKRAEKEVDDLRERLAAAERRQFERLFAKHKMLISTAARRNIEAQKAAAAANVASIEAFAAARAELGSIAEQGLIPRVNFAGIPLPDLVEVWEKEINRSLATLDRAELPPPAAPAGAGRQYFRVPGMHSTPMPEPAAPAPVVVRPVALPQPAALPEPEKPRPSPLTWTAERAPDDLAPLASGEVRVRALADNWTPANDRQAVYRGQVLRLPRRLAEAAEGRGQAEIIEYPEAP
jgi:hypothetical protein